MRRFLALIAIMCLSEGAQAQPFPATDITFDDSQTSVVKGADVQVALEDTDGELSTLIADVSTLSDHHEGVENAAEVVLLRKLSCDGRKNCFTTMAALETWIWNTRKPTATTPLLVDIGPGEFGPFTCPSATPRNGFVTLRGTGTETTTIRRQAAGIGLVDAGVAAHNCDDLGFEALRIQSAAVGVSWTGSGTSTWSNVLVEAIHEPGSSVVIAGWYDLNGTSCPNGSSTATHYWFGSKLRSVGGSFNFGYIATCSENWFYGGEIEAHNGIAQNFGVFSRLGGGDFRAFGTAIRSLAGPQTDDDATFGVVVNDGSVFHMHGGIINANAKAGASTVNTVGLHVSGAGSFGHTPGTAFIVSPGSAGTAKRLDVLAGGVADSPFVWPKGSEPPDIATTDGSDLFVEDDCSSAGDCNVTDCEAEDCEAHLMVYNAAVCETDPWFDTVTGRCRNDTVDPLADRVAALEASVADHQTRLTTAESTLVIHDATLIDHEDRITALEP